MDGWVGRLEASLLVRPRSCYGQSRQDRYGFSGFFLYRMEREVGIAVALVLLVVM